MNIDLVDMEKLEKRIAYGTNILKELFKLSDEELKDKIKELIRSEYVKILDQATAVRRTIVDEQPEKIEFLGWDTIVVSWSGIRLHTEYGETVVLREFDEHFKL